MYLNELVQQCACANMCLYYDVLLVTAKEIRIPFVKASSSTSVAGKLNYRLNILKYLKHGGGEGTVVHCNVQCVRKVGGGGGVRLAPCRGIFFKY